MQVNWSRKEAEFLAEVARARQREMNDALADAAGLDDVAEGRLATLHLELGLDGTEEEFIAEARLIIHRLLGLRDLDERSSPQGEVRRELQTVVKALRALSEDALNQLASPLRWAWVPGDSFELMSEAIWAERWLLKLTDSESLVDELVRRSEKIISHGHRGRSKDPARRYLAVSAAALLRRLGAQVDASRTGTYVEFLAVLIQAAGLEYDARAVAREFPPTPA